MRTPLIAAVILSCTGGLAFAAVDTHTVDAPAMAKPASPLVQTFVQSAGIGNQFEMTTSQLALAKSQDPGVRRFAQKMLNDHLMAEMTLERAAAPSGVTTHFMFDKPHQTKIDELEALSGQGFDEAYWAVQRDAHAEAEAAVGDYAATGSDPALRAWAGETLPVIVSHQRMIADLTGTSAVPVR